MRRVLPVPRIFSRLSAATRSTPSPGPLPRSIREGENNNGEAAPGPATRSSPSPGPLPRSIREGENNRGANCMAVRGSKKEGDPFGPPLLKALETRASCRLAPCWIVAASPERRPATLSLRRCAPLCIPAQPGRRRHRLCALPATSPAGWAAGSAPRALRLR